jgi:flagellar biosynthesis protein FliQ
VNDPAVGFVPRVVAGLGVLWALGPWMTERLAGFLAHALARMAE